MLRIGSVLALATLAAAGAGRTLAADQASDDMTLLTSQTPKRARGGSDEQVVLPANPLWAVRLGDLPVTQQRPIFSPSRRPRAPPPVLAAPPPAPRPVAVPREPERPPLALIGTFVSESLQIAIFREEETKEMMRLKSGDDYKGWLLSSVTAGEVKFEGPERNAVLALAVAQATAPSNPTPASPAPALASDPSVRHRKR